MTNAAPNPTAPERNVFISYASHDKAVADAVCDALERAGVVCWVAPRDVTPGEFYAESIVHAIDSTKVIVLVLSKSASDSQHVLSEVERARSRRHPVVSLRIDAVPLPAALEYFLNTSQWLDARTTGVAASLPRLVDAVKAALSQPVTSARSAAVSPAITRSSRRERPVLIALGVLASAALAYLAVAKFWLPTPAPAQSSVTSPTAAISDKSIAVLPFADMSEKHDQEYFADGMAEEIIERLSQVPSLHVPGRASSFYFKGKTTKLSEIAQELGVANLVEGSVRKSGDHLRIGAQLVRVSDGYTVWSESFDRKLADVFEIQDEIATAVASGLQATLSGGSLNRELGGTRNLEAYQLYLRALSGFREVNIEALQASRSMLEGATRMDANFGLAWAQLSIVLMNLADTGALSAADGSERARQAAMRAITVSPGLGDAHAALGYVYLVYDWNWPAAAAESQRALVLDPNGLEALNLAGLLAVTLGHGDEAERWQRKVLARDPLFSYAHFNLANALYLSGHYVEAEAVFRRLLTLQKKYAWGHPWLAKTLIAEGKPQEAFAVLQPLMDDGDALLYLPETLLANGRKAEADKAIQRLANEQGDASAYYVAQYYAYAHDKDRAMQWLERAYVHRDTGLVEIVGEPLLRNLWSDPRFKAFLRKMNLPE